MDAYQEFLEAKRHNAQNYGIEPTFRPDNIFEFQKYVCDYSIKKGRCAAFLDTGLGKTIIELTIAKNYVKETNKPVLILTPLAVAFQFLREAEKFGIDDVEYSRVGKYPGEVVLTPFMGVGSEVYSPVSMGRKAIGVELKDTYFKQSVKNLIDVKNRFAHLQHAKLF
jgi:hypothetical protein